MHVVNYYNCLYQPCQRHVDFFIYCTMPSPRVCYPVVPICSILMLDFH